MPALIDARNSGLDVTFSRGTARIVPVEFYQDDAATIPQVLTGRTFEATLGGVALTTTAPIGHAFTVTVSVAQTTAAAAGQLDFVLTETTGTDEPIIQGKWRASTNPNAVTPTGIVKVSSATSTVKVAVLSGLAASVGNLVVAGQASFGLSPLVPNPAALNPAAAASIGEVKAQIAASSAGFVRSMDPKPTLLPPLSNSTTEVSLLDAVFSMPRLTHKAVFRMVAGGVCRCTAGGPVNITLRLRNLTDGLVVASAVVQLATDTELNRPWQFEVNGEGNFVLADSACSVANLIVGAGATDTLKQALGQQVNVNGSDPQNWDVTAQASVANAGITLTPFSAQLLYALPGA